MTAKQADNKKARKKNFTWYCGANPVHKHLQKNSRFFLRKFCCHKIQLNKKLFLCPGEKKMKKLRGISPHCSSIEWTRWSDQGEDTILASDRWHDGSKTGGALPGLLVEICLLLPAVKVYEQPCRAAANSLLYGSPNACSLTAPGIPGCAGRENAEWWKAFLITTQWNPLTIQNLCRQKARNFPLVVHKIGRQAFPIPCIIAISLLFSHRPSARQMIQAVHSSCPDTNCNTIIAGLGMKTLLSSL